MPFANGEKSNAYVIAKLSTYEETGRGPNAANLLPTKYVSCLSYSWYQGIEHSFTIHECFRYSEPSSSKRRY